ncbi:hypothetical protein ACFQJC_04400 [Haloferax namakaokahaiae]|uniref:DUF7573 domain-containing protein n=1 Tax=Haloferax namakaokahaiae TaxID=1748331 RepID=A0ABD5ZC07_9EURY
MANFSLDDFDGDEADTEDRDERVEPDDDSPEIDTLATYRWTPEATACPRCGTAVQKRWLDDDEYVCDDCKSW